MIGDLPELGDIFSENKDEERDRGHEETEKEINLSDKDIYIYLSKGDDKWISVAFLDIAPSGIGLHVILPLQIEFTPDEVKNMCIKFERKTKKSSIILKEAPVMIRWQEKDQVSGRMKLGVHFPGNVKSETEIKEILKILKAQNQNE